MIRLKVREIATEKKIGQGKLARAADVDVKTIQRVLRDPYADITLGTLDKIARALGVDPRELIEPVVEGEKKQPEIPEEEH